MMATSTSGVPLLLLMLLTALTAAHKPESESVPSPQLALIMQLFQQQASLIDHLKTDQKKIKADLNSFKEQQASSAKSLRGDLDSYKKKAVQVERQVQILKQRPGSQSVAFTARLSRDNQKGVALSYHQTLVFDDVVTNVGAAYNPRTGIFSAPVDGTYAFSLSLMSPNYQRDVYLAVVKNGNVLDMAFGRGEDRVYDQGSTLVTTHLTKGDRVWVRQQDGNGVRGSWWTVFAGFRLP